MKPPVSVAVPLSLVTATSTLAPGVPVGVSQVLLVSFTTTAWVAEPPSKVTVFVPAPLFRNPVPRSDERRVGKEGRSRWAPEH